MLTLLILACKGGNGDLDSGDVRFADADGDGYNIDQGDCDDGQGVVFPGKAEVCDGLDNNCDGAIDEGLTTPWYLDGDGDGFGADGTAAQACTQPENYIAQGGDCDDSTTAVKPGLAESCDLQDNDCDGDVDEDVESTFYKDFDGDGTGDPDQVTTACEAPEGYVDNAYDCDDRFADINELAADICDDTDNDCDGETDEDPDIARYRDADGDGHGDPTDTVNSCDKVAGYVDAGDDLDDADATEHPGATELCDGDDDDGDGSVDEGSDAIGALTWYKDADGDGFGYAGSVTKACDQPSGYVANTDDCDDSSAGISPIDVEIAYDGVDQDCDGDDLTDVDGDGQDSTSVSGGKDCDDGDSTVYYGAAEYCDGLDNDCDSSTDESDAVDPSTWYADSDSDGYGDPDTTAEACDQPSGYVSDASDCDDGSSLVSPAGTETCDDGIDQDCDGDADDGCPQYHSGTITKNETWDKDDLHVITGDLTIGSSSTVTIEDGATVEVDPGKGIYVGPWSSGALKADGSTLGITFTSSESSPAAGDWDGLFFFGNNDSSTTTLKGITIEYAGGESNYPAGLYAASTKISVSDCTITDSAQHGIYAATTTLTLDGCTIADNAKNGVYLDSYSTLSGLTNSTLTTNGGYPLQMPADQAKNASSTSSYAGNTKDTVALDADTITKSMTWAALDVPYRLTGTLNIGSTSTVILTLDDGVEIQVDPAKAITVGYGSYGALKVNGTSAGVTITSSSASPAEGDWYGIHFWGGTDDANTVLDGLTVEYGGYGGYANIYMWDSSPTIKNSTIQKGEGSGIHIDNGAYPKIQDNLITDNRAYGVYVENAYGGLNTTGVSFSGNTVTNNDDLGVYIQAADVDEIDTDNTFSGNGSDVVGVASGTITTSTTWQDPGVPWYITGDITQSSGTMTIEDGAELSFTSGAQLSITSSGILDVQGTTLGVTFTSSGGAMGSWDGIYLYNTSGSGTSKIDGADIEFGGGNGYGCVYSQGGTSKITNSHIHDCAGSGVYASDWYNTPSMQISDTTLEDNENYGLYLDGGYLGATNSFTNNVLTGNGLNGAAIEGSGLRGLDSTSTFTGNGTDTLLIIGGSTTAGYTWTLPKLDVDYHVTTTTGFYGTVTVEEGTTFLMDSGVTFYVYDDFYAYGTATAPITWTSVESSPSAGDWGGIFPYFAGTVVFDYCVVEYGGSIGANIYTQWTSALTISNCTIQNSSTWGAYTSYYTTVKSHTGNTYSGNSSGTYSFN